MTAHRVARFVIRNRTWCVALWIAALAVAAPFAHTVQDRLDTGVKIPGSETATVDALIAHRFNSPFAQYAIVVVRGLAPVDSDSSAEHTLGDIATAVRRLPGVSGTVSYADSRDSVFLGRGGGTFIIVGLPAANVDTLLPELRAGTASIRERLRARHPDLDLLWTGTAPLASDLRVASAADASHAERRVIPLTLVLLAVAFGSIVAACLPVAIGAVAIVLTLGVVSLIARATSISVLALNVTTMLGLGLGIDYALLFVTRFREQRARGCSSPDAALQTLVHAGHTVMVAGAAVMLGFAALLLVPLSDLRSIAIGGLVVTCISVALATTLLPALLALVGDRVGARRIRRGRTGDFWGKWSIGIVRHPVLALIVFGVPVVALATQWTRLARRMPNGDWLPPHMESARGVATLRAMRRGGMVQSIRLLVVMPGDERALAPTGWPIVQEVQRMLASNPRIARIRSLSTAIGPHVPSETELSLLPSPLLQTFVSRDGRIALIEAEPADSVSPADAMRLVSDLRAHAHGIGDRLGGARVLVGGLPAVNVDYQAAVARATPRVAGLVILGTMLALLLAFRSVMIPMKAIALNLAAVSAAFGIVVLVFQKGYGLRLLGVDEPLDGIFAAVPLIVFCAVFGLSMDYEVFLVSRVAEARRRGAAEGTAIVTGVRRTGRVITSAALVMAVVFGAFMLGDFVLMKILGLALTAAVLIDATIVRIALGPALLALAGRWNWWPGRRYSAVTLPSRTSAPSSLREETFTFDRMFET